MGWNQEVWGDQLHGPIGHGFDVFFGVPFTLVDGFQKGAHESFFSAKSLKALLKKKLADNGDGVLPKTIQKVMQGGGFFGLAFSGLLTMKALGVSAQASVVAGLAWWFTIQHMKVFTAKWWQRSDFMEMVLNSNLMEMPGDKVVMQPIDQSRSSSLINKKAIEFIEKKDPKPWAV